MSAVATVAINVDARDATGQLRQLQTQSKLTERAFGSLASALATLGVGIGLSKVLSDVKELDTNLRRLATVGGDVAQLDKALGDLSERLGGVASKAELAAASYQAASAGFSDTAGNVRILEAATKAAVGGLASAEGVTEVLVKTLNAYGMAGTDAYKVTDSISKAVEVGNQEWSDYVSQLGRVASISALAGVSLDEVNAFIASATKNGATAEIAFTGLGAALNTLLQPTKESQEAAKALGIEWNLQGLSAKGFTGLMTELAKKQDTNKESVARLLGSQEAMRGVFAANAKQGKDFANILGQLGDATGKTDSDFQTMKVSLENQLKALDTAFKNLSEALGKAFGASVVDSIKGVTGAINGFADIINAIPRPVATATAELVKLLAQMLILKKAIEGIIALRMAFVAAMTSMATTTTAAGTAATTSSSAFALYTSNTKALQAAAATATPALSGLRAMLANLAAVGVITIGINLVTTGLQEAMTAAAEVRRLRGERAAGGAAAIYQGSATQEQKGKAAQTLQQVRREQASYQQPGTIALQTLLGPASQLFGIPTIGQASARRVLLMERAARAQATMALPTRTAAQAGLEVGQAVGSTAPAAAAAAAGGGKAGGGKGKTDAEKAADAIKQSFQDGLKLNIELNRQLKLEKAANEYARERLQIQFTYRDRLKQIGELKNKDQKLALEELAIKLRDLDLQKLATKEYAEQNRLFYERAGFTPGEPLGAGAGAFRTDINLDPLATTDPITEYSKRLKDLMDPINQAKAGADAIGTAFNDAFSGLITGTQTAQEALGNFFKGISDSFLQMATQMITEMIKLYVFKSLLGLFGGGGGAAGGLFKGAGPVSGASVFGTGQAAFNPLSFGAGVALRAMGGPVTAGQSYVVGERGPELFTPSSGGMITPNNRAGGGGVAVTVNVDAKGTSVESNDQQAGQLGRVIAAAVQAELVNQKRRGGLLNP